jgi:NitT/TauT family transport system substrate-binding protein
VKIITYEISALFLPWIDKNGRDSKTVKMIEIPFPEMLSALDIGRVDVAIPSEPFTSQCRAGNRAIGNCYEALSSQMLLFGVFATDAWLAANVDTALTFAAGINQAAIWANANPKASAFLLTRFTDLAPAVAKAMGRATSATALEPSMIQPAIECMVKYGVLPQMIDASALIWRSGK